MFRDFNSKPILKSLNNSRSTGKPVIRSKPKVLKNTTYGYTKPVIREKMSRLSNNSNYNLIPVQKTSYYTNVNPTYYSRNMNAEQKRQLLEKIKSSNINSKDSNSSLINTPGGGLINEKIYNEVLCSICLECIVSELNLSFNCEHKYCVKCFRTYIKTKIAQQDTIKIKCLECSCSNYFTDKDIQRIF